MREFEIPDGHPLVLALDGLIAWAKSSDILEERLRGEPCDGDYLTRENLGIVSQDEKRCGYYTARFDDHEGYDYSEVDRHMAAVFEDVTGITEYEQQRRAKTWYPPNGHLGWHLDGPGGKFYATYAEGRSFFRYVDPETGEVVTSWDKPGWTFRTFYTDDENPFWHCVWAQDTRISIGHAFLEPSAVSGMRQWAAARKLNWHR
jgi:hypothetical protein